MHTITSAIARRAAGPALIAAVLTLGACASSTAAGESRAHADQQNCITGAFDVRSIETSTLVRLKVDDGGIRGTGGSFRLHLRADGTWRLSDDGSREMRIVAGTWTGGFSADGWVEGRYERSGNAWHFTHHGASGTASLELHMLDAIEVPLGLMSHSIIPDGRVSVTCDSDGITLVSGPETISLVLHRDTSDEDSADL